MACPCHIYIDNVTGGFVRAGGGVWKGATVTAALRNTGTPVCRAAPGLPLLLSPERLLLLCGCAYGGALVTDPVELDVLCKPRPRVFRGIPIEAEARFTPRFTPPALSLTGEREYLVYAYDW